MEYSAGNVIRMMLGEWLSDNGRIIVMVSIIQALLADTVNSRHTDKSRSSRYRDIGNLAVAIAISGK